jgi:hypothetical protein
MGRLPEGVYHRVRSSFAALAAVQADHQATCQALTMMMAASLDDHGLGTKKMEPRCEKSAPGRCARR